MPTAVPYEVFALRYATRPSTRSDQYFRYDVYGEPDAEQTMDYYAWVARNEDRTVLVDCGFHSERGARRNRLAETDLFELLSRLEITPESVTHLVISHMHFDHVGNLAAFPNATFSIAAAEYRFWTGPYGQTRLTRTIVDAEDIETLQRLKAESRLTLIDAATTLFDGIEVTPVGGHAPGQMITNVEAGQLQVVLASDAAHYYEAFRRAQPIKLFHDLDAMYSAYELLRELEARAGTVIVPGHEPLVAQLFESLHQNCIDLTAPLAGSGASAAILASAETKPRTGVGNE